MNDGNSFAFTKVIAGFTTSAIGKFKIVDSLTGSKGLVTMGSSIAVLTVEVRVACLSAGLG